MIDSEMRAWARWTGTARAGLAPERERRAPETGAGGGGGGGGIVLATLHSTPFQAQAADLAVDLALESASRLVVVNAVEMPLGRGPRRDLGDPHAVAAALEAPVLAAESMGTHATALRVRSLRPLATLLDVVVELRPAVVVFGPDPARLSRLRHISPAAYRRAARALERRTECLLWRPMPDLLAGPSPEGRARPPAAHPAR